MSPTTVIEHSAAIDPAITATHDLARGVVVCNEMGRRGRAVGLDLFLRAQQGVPLDLMGISSDALGGIGDIPYTALPMRLAPYRFLFSPMRYTSLPLAVIEAMTVGLPIIALATTELPNVIENGVIGYISTDPDELIERMRALLDDRALAQRLGANARSLARERFGLPRFVRDWNAAIERAVALRTGAEPLRCRQRE